MKIRGVAIFAIFATGSVQAGDNVWTSLEQGGPVTALSIDPQNPSTVYAASGGGLFKSADGGADWSAVIPGPPCCVSTLAIDPHNPITIYAVTLDRRVLKSTDGGANWSPAGLYGVTSLAIDPQNPTTVYAGTALPGGGVFKTADGGESWNAMSSGLPDGGVMALAIDPQSASTIYASTRTSGVFQSSDGGASWSAVNSGLERGITSGSDYMSFLMIDPQNPDTIYAASHFVVDGGDADNGLFKTTDAGASWTGMNLFALVTALAIDPQNSGTVYAGTYAGVSKSTDGGKSWSAVKSRQQIDSYGSSVISALAIDPRDSNTVYAAGIYAGVSKTTDAGASWTVVNSDLGVTTPTGLMALRIDPQNPGTIYAGTDTGIFKTTDAGATWTAVNAGLPNGPYGHLSVSILEIDPQNGGTIYAVDPCCQNIFKSTDGGATWAGVLALDASGLVVRGARLTADAVALDPRNPNTVYAAGFFDQSGQQNGENGVLRSTDGGMNWSAVSSGLPVSSRDQSAFVTTVAIDPQNSSAMYAGIGTQGFLAGGSAVFKTTDGGGSWRNAGMAGFTRVDILAIDPQNTSNVYAGAVDRIGYRLYKTANGGASWSWLSSGLPNYITDLAIDPQNSGTLYAGSGSGVFRSLDGGANWEAMNSGLTTLSISALAIDSQNPRTLYAGASDSGVFAITLVP
jgi:photosystem II stability/assembly factor-like uncharacterized protein